ncbi:conserved Plasmodium protein, unknown function [Plasmodium chabaudi chabaudi]|uniref:Uncharacterized protein n=1 Tax=Plasmodium chabaudi chabaudi TaxID=31271 RepID=A0A4V0K4L3_PLACU|nr:conserved Plasmodium protein, unknown function [Plasmodium chabaudi chabaudi]VTZ67541.1 conserved Plasmodium protein, unknown function [Plasmodium chabaudi chabaudi]|eukprot:XP_737228.2 conserved Plasmodium protein, unknown function [Plasmodium chabaudi chabaudi]
MKCLHKCDIRSVQDRVYSYIKIQVINHQKLYINETKALIKKNDGGKRFLTHLSLGHNKLKGDKKYFSFVNTQNDKINEENIKHNTPKNVSISQTEKGKQSEMIRKIRKFCRKDDLCSIYKFNDNFLDLLKSKKLNENDFSVIIHLLNTKKIKDNSFWRSVASAENINFIFNMNLKQIIITIYSISNSFPFIHLNFLNPFTFKLIYILYYQKYFLLITNKSKNKQECAENFVNVFNSCVTNELEKITKKNEKNRNSCTVSAYSESEKKGWNKLISQNDYSDFKIIFNMGNKSNNSNYNGNENMLSEHRTNINRLNFFDITILCNTYSKINAVSQLEYIQEFKHIIYKLFIYFLFFHNNEMDYNHLILFIYSYTNLKGTIDKSVFSKIKKILLTKHSIEHPNLYKIHTIDICSLNMLMHVLKIHKFNDNDLFKHIILSCVVNLNLSKIKKSKLKKGVLNSNGDALSDAMSDGYDHSYAQFMHTNMDQNTDEKKIKNENINNAGDSDSKYNNTGYSYSHKNMLEKRAMIVNYFSQNDNSYIMHTKTEENLIQLNKKDLCFLACNIDKLQIPNYYNIYEYIKIETQKQINIFNVYNTCVILKFLVNLNLLDKNLFNLLLSHFKILFDKNHYNEKDITDIYLSFYKYTQIASCKNNSEISNFLKFLYTQIEHKLNKFNYINIIYIFCSCAYFNIRFSDILLQNLCIDILNNFKSIDEKILLPFLYFIKKRDYDINHIFFNSAINNLFSKIKNSKSFFYIFQILSVYSIQTLQRETHILHKLVDLLDKFSPFLSLKDKILLSLHIYINPVLSLNKRCIQFCENILKAIVCDEETNGGDAQILEQIENHEMLDKYIEKNIKHVNTTYNCDIIKKTCNSQLGKRNKKETTNFPFYNCFYTHSDTLLNNIDFNTNNINIKELKIYFLLLLSDIYEIKLNTFLKKEQFPMLGKNRTEQIQVQNYINALHTCQLKILLNFTHIPLNNEYLIYLLKKNDLFNAQNCENKSKLTEEINYSDKNIRNTKKLKDKKKNTNSFYNNNLKTHYDEEIMEYFPEFEESLFNATKIMYENSFIYSLYQKNKQNEENNVENNLNQSNQFHVPPFPYISFGNTNNELIIKIKKNVFINSFYIFYILPRMT